MKINNILFDKILSNILKANGIALVLVVLLQVFARLTMEKPVTWTEEMSRFLFIWFCFLSSALTMNKKMHLGIDFFYEKFGLTSKKIVDFIIIVLILIFGIILIYYGFFVLKIVGIQKSPILRWPMSYFYGAIPVAGILYTINSILSLWEKCFRNQG